MSFTNKATWNVLFHTFLTHIRHDIQKGIDNQKYNWDNVQINRQGEKLQVFQNNELKAKLTISSLGTESAHSEDNSIFKVLSPETLNVKSQIKQKELEKMNSNQLVNEAVSTVKTVAQQIQSSALTSAKMEAGENILLALRNIVMTNAGFMQKVKFKFAPIALDVAVVVGADILVAELFPTKKSAKLAVECLNLAMTKEVIHSLPITDFTNALTGGSALGKVKAMLSADDE